MPLFDPCTRDDAAGSADRSRVDLRMQMMLRRHDFKSVEVLLQEPLELVEAVFLVMVGIWLAIVVPVRRGYQRLSSEQHVDLQQRRVRVWEACDHFPSEEHIGSPGRVKHVPDLRRGALAFLASQPDAFRLYVNACHVKASVCQETLMNPSPHATSKRLPWALAAMTSTMWSTCCRYTGSCSYAAQ
jgi:hypothetical protein